MNGIHEVTGSIPVRSTNLHSQPPIPVDTSTRCGRGGQSHANPQRGQHIDQGVRAEQVDATAKKIADTGLRDPQHPGGLNLLERTAEARSVQ